MHHAQQSSHRSTGRRLAILLALLIILVSVTSCSLPVPDGVATEAARAKETAMAEAGRLAGTKAAELLATAPVVISTGAANIVTTAQVAIATEEARLLTPQPVMTAEAPDGESVVTYTIIEGDTLTKVAQQFSLDLDALIQLNGSRYPSLLDDPNHLETGWVLIVATGPQVTATPPPPAPTSLPTPPVCAEPYVYWIEGFACQEYQVDVVTKVGLSIGCVALDENPLGYYMTHTVYQGWVITINGSIFGYGWFVDRELNQVVIGPAVVEETYTYVECGIPGNP